MSAYRKEIRSTITFGAVYVLLGHTGLWAVMFGTDSNIRVLGLPVHYVIAITLGSLGVLLCSIVWCRHANALEDEIEAENAGFLRDDETSGASSGVRSMSANGMALAELAK